MVLSDRKRQELFEAIHQPVMDARISVKMAENDGASSDVDKVLFGLTGAIWAKVKTALGIRE